MLYLPALKTVTQSAGSWTIKQANYGYISLPGLTSVAGGPFQPLTLAIQGAGVFSNLVTLDHVDCTLTQIQPNLNWTRFTNGSLTVNGSQCGLPYLTDFDNSSAHVTGGGYLGIQDLSTYNGNGTFSADGSQSALDASGLSKITGSGTWSLAATAGGTIKLTNLGNLVNTSGTPQKLIVRGDGTISDNNLTMLEGVTVILDGTNTQAARFLETLKDGSLQVTGGAYNLPALTDLDGSSVYVSGGGTLSLLGLVNYQSNDSTFSADGPGTVLDLSSLVDVTQQHGPWSVVATEGGTLFLKGLDSLAANGDNHLAVTFGGNGTIDDANLVSLNGVDVTLDGTNTEVTQPWQKVTAGSLVVTGGSYNLEGLRDIDGSDIRVQGGAKLALPGITSFAPDNNHFTAAEAGSVLDLSNLSSVAKTSAQWYLTAVGGEIKLNDLSSLSEPPSASIFLDDEYNGTILDPKLVNLSGVDATFDGTDQQIAGYWMSITNGEINLTRGSLRLPALVDIDGTSLVVQDGGKLALPAATTYTAGGAFSANGPNSTLDLSALTAVSGPGALAVSATNGGEVNLSGMSSLVNTSPVPLPISFSGNGTIVDGNLTKLSGIAVTLDGSNTQAATPWTTLTSGSLTVTGGSYRLTALTDLDESSLYVKNGATLALPGLVNCVTSGTFQADAPGILLDLSALATVAAGQNPWQVSATDGGAIDLTGLTQIANESGSAFDVSFAGNSTIVDTNLISLDGVSVTLDGTNTAVADFWTTLTNGSLTVTGGTYRLSRLRNISGSSVQLSGRAALTLPSTSNDAADGVVTLGGSASLDINGDLHNNAALTVGAGCRLTVAGSFVQTPSGSLNVEISGPPASGDFSQVAVTGTATLAGALKVAITKGFIPSDGQSFSVITFASAKGSFATISGLNPFLRERIQPTSLDLATSLRDTIDSPTGVTIAATESATFNGTVASFTDANPLAQPGDFSATIDWGDGNTTAGTLSATGGGGFQVTGSHAYAEDGSETITVSVANVGGVSATIQSQATVAEASALGKGTTLAVGQTTPLSEVTVATFTHGNGVEPAANFTATIDWGDGQTSAGVVQESNDVYAVIGSHTYAQNGTFSVQATVTDDSATTAIDSSAIVLSVDAENANYVTAVYHDMLGRAPDAAGLAYWTHLLDSGTAIASVAEAIAHSGEYYANFVIKPDYLKLLGRAAGAEGLNYWTAKMEAGLTDQQLEADFVASNEFYQTAGGTNSAWITAAYNLLLGRPAAASDVSFWLGRLSAGATIFSVAQVIADSRENDAHIINNDYFNYLGRAADDAGLAYWQARLAAGETNEDVIAAFTGSSEYYQKHST